jgi:hypothetical protein
VVCPDGTFAKKGDAQAWLSNVESDRTRGILGQPKGTTKTLAVYAYEWMDQRAKPLKPHSRSHYDEILRHHILPTLGKFILSEIYPEPVKRWHTSISAISGAAVMANSSHNRLEGVCLATPTVSGLLSRIQRRW